LNLEISECMRGANSFLFDSWLTLKIFRFCLFYHQGMECKHWSCKKVWNLKYYTDCTMNMGSSFWIEKLEHACSTPFLQICNCEAHCVQLWFPATDIKAFLYPFQVECLFCCRSIYPGEGIQCSVRNCQGVYHLTCVVEGLGVSNLRKFKCPQHVRSS